MKKIEPSTQIAPGFTVTDWNALRQILIKDFDKDGLPESWIRAQQVFEARIMNRFFSRLKKLLQRIKKEAKDLPLCPSCACFWSIWLPGDMD